MLLALGIGLLACLAIAVTVWAVSVIITDASIVDIFWGTLCATPALTTYLIFQDTVSPRDMVLLALVWLWALRLGLYLAKRNLPNGEDYRYRKMRENQGSDAAMARWSLVRVFILQAVIAWFVSFPTVIGQFGGDGTLGILAYLGIAVFFIGFVFEAGGDWQLVRFKNNPANKGKLMTRGLWAWTRHPNYFGNAALWTGLTLIALEAPWGWTTILSPGVMLIFLYFISGKAMTQRKMKKKYGEQWKAYEQRTSGFFPLPPDTSVTIPEPDNS